MAKTAGAASVLKAEKRNIAMRGDTSLRASSVYLFWLAVSMGSLVLAAISYITTDIGERVAEEFTGVDARTTAGIVPINRGITVAQRVDQGGEVEQQQQQRRQLDDLTRVMHRLRGEQASLTNRVAEIDAAVTRNRNRTKALEDRVTEGFAQLRTDAATVNVSKLSFPPNLDPEATPVTDPRAEVIKSPGIVPQSVKTQRLGAEAATSAPLNPEPATAESAATAEKSASSSYAKTVRTIAARGEAVDQTVVGSIARAESTQFAIDLGVNPTVERAQDLWESIGKSHPGIHRSGAPRYVPTGNQEGETRLIVGPYADANDAIKACVALRLAKSFCKTTLFPN